jgi:transcriptional regulator with GAF, ATPase, and Fis domain
MNIASLQRVAFALAQSQDVESVLQIIVRGLAEQTDVAMARVWLKGPGDICATCSMESSCSNRNECLHLLASAGNPAGPDPTGEVYTELSRTNGNFTRIPLNTSYKVGMVGLTGQELLLHRDSAEGSEEWIDRSEWVERQMIESFAAQPLIFKNEVLGVLGMFSRRKITEDEFVWLRTFADGAAVGIANARYLEQKKKVAEDLRLQIEVLQNIPVTAWTVTADGQLDFVNKTYLDVLGQTLEACTVPLHVWNRSGSDLPPFLSALHPDHKERVRQIFWDGIRSGKGWTFEAPFLHGSDQRYHWHIDRAVPLRDDDGNVVRFVGSCADIDDLKQAEAKSKIALDEIKALKAKLERENTYLLETIQRQHDFAEIVGQHPRLLKLLDSVEAAAPTDANVLIFGETGSGKELIARAVHDRSGRRGRALVKVNCGAMPTELVESELFGHVRGAFTGAVQTRIGRFELAEGGTLFLDEVGDLPLETQVKLLRVLQERQFEPVGSNRTVDVNVRVLAATNRDLGKAVQAGQFRSDLYYRLNVIPLHVPPLRERRSDIPELVSYFVEQSSKRIGKPMKGVSTETMQTLIEYAWPGNIRELQNVIERGVILSRRDILVLGPDLLPIEAASDTVRDDVPGLSASLEEVERAHILKVLDATGWLISGPSGAGAILKIHPNTLRSRMKKLGIERANHAIS